MNIGNIQDMYECTQTGSCEAQVRTVPRPIVPNLAHAHSASIFDAVLMAMNSFTSPRQVIDISGDGFNNSGRTMREGRQIASTARVTVNGLAIQNQVLDLGGYFEEYVITGPGAFVITAEDYIKAIRRKLLKEIKAPPIS